jgi:hypothetical protein
LVGSCQFGKVKKILVRPRIDSTCYNRDNQILSIAGDNGLPTPFPRFFQHGPTQPIAESDISARYRPLYTLKCVVEYLKHAVRFFYLVMQLGISILRGLGVLGDGLYLRRVDEARPSMVIDEVVVFDDE